MLMNGQVTVLYKGNVMNDSELLIYQDSDGQIKIDVHLEDETVWLTQEHMAELFGKSKKTISEHIRNIFNEGELDEQVVVRKFRTTTRHGAMPDKTQSREVHFYNQDWIQRLDAILQINGRELLTHAGRISHQMALEKSTLEYDKYRQTQKQIQHEESLKELERDIQRIIPSGKSGASDE